ncbi:MAG: HNH endonuclease [Bacteroidota bacterium]|nr:HNH endonuclease [Bacteroidota bacterium]
MPKSQFLVNLDAMIIRADFAQTTGNDNSSDTIDKISLSDFTSSLTGRLLRKPDFQRETNHWTPNQVFSLLECFISGDLIPSVILWKSPTYLFVIDGGHRLSVLKAWVEDDYGDGPLSLKYFGDSISLNQKKAADRTRKLITDNFGSYQHIKTKLEQSQIDAKITTVFTRALPVQWVKGDAEKAEASFFKINTQGTPLDEIEHSLLEFRKRPIAISARAIIRAGKGHKYWSSFSEENTQIIEDLSKKLHYNLFDPETTSPLKTLDLPLGGSKGVRAALQILISYLGIACISQTEKDNKIDYGTDDISGDQTITILKKAQKLTVRITGNDKGSLGLHPAIYFYGPSGVHSAPLFLGTAKFISEKPSNNDNEFFKHFTLSRSKIEDFLINHKDLIATVLQKLGSNKRTDMYAKIINNLYLAFKNGEKVTEQNIIDWASLSGKIFVGNEKSTNSSISDETKSKIFIFSTLKQTPKCSICQGYIDSTKSMSYDHITRKQDGGLGDFENVQLTHPYCNQSIKN